MAKDVCMTVSQKAFDFIIAQIGLGKDVYICTYGRAIKITKKTVASWDKVGKPLFFIDNIGDLRIRSGKNSNVIATKTISLVTIKAV